jgi:hypothetical protein
MVRGISAVESLQGKTERENQVHFLFEVFTIYFCMSRKWYYIRWLKANFECRRSCLMSGAHLKHTNHRLNMEFFGLLCTAVLIG